MPEEMRTIKCGNCGKEAHGVYSTVSMQASYIAGFYSVSEGSIWHRYRQGEESFLCKPCLHLRMRDERRSMQP